MKFQYVSILLAPLFLLNALLVLGDETESTEVEFVQGENHVQISIRGKEIANYVFKDEKTLRPYFKDLRTLEGNPVTRNHPPVAGKDSDDHAAMHPGLWLAFGDLNGIDFWRNQGGVRHVRFSEKPHAQGGTGSFSVENAYELAGKVICQETCELTFTVQANGYLLDWRSTFQSKEKITFGDQEEMGLGIRMATPLTVEKEGEILDSAGRKNGKEVWGKQADWCQYSGKKQQSQLGVLLIPDSNNFRPSWFHARDYGLLVANPFGRKAFTQGEVSQVEVKAGELFQLRFGIFVFQTPADRPLDSAAVYRKILQSYQ